MLERARWLRAAPLAVALAAAAPLQACFGKFALVRTIYQWNDNASEDYIVKELIFLLFVILPVYGVAGLIDAFILNPIEVITGENPISAADAELRPTADGFVLRTVEDGVERTYRIRRTATGLELIDEAGRVLAVTERTLDGGLQVIDGDGRVLNAASPAMLADLGAALRSGDRDAVLQVAGGQVDLDACVVLAR